MEFSKKIVLITGAASGIGKGAALSFAQKGAVVIVADINEKGGLETVDEIVNASGEAIFIQVDVSSFESVQNLMREIVNTFGHIDIAINNAGIAGHLAKSGDATLENWDKVMAINSSGVFYCLKLEIVQMLKQGGGVIVNTSSIAGLRGLPNSIAYCASKHAVVGMTKTAAMEYARYNIRINAICPSFSVTPLFDPEKIDAAKAGLSEKLKAGIPMKRFGTVEEQVNAILWLCSDKAGYTTGLALPIDGGLTA